MKKVGEKENFFSIIFVQSTPHSNTQFTIYISNMYGNICRASTFKHDLNLVKLMFEKILYDVNNSEVP
jgi:hypothetical protein